CQDLWRDINRFKQPLVWIRGMRPRPNLILRQIHRLKAELTGQRFRHRHLLHSSRADQCIPNARSRWPRFFPHGNNIAVSDEADAGQDRHHRFVLVRHRLSTRRGIITNRPGKSLSFVLEPSSRFWFGGRGRDTMTRKTITLALLLALARTSIAQNSAP